MLYTKFSVPTATANAPAAAASSPESSTVLQPGDVDELLYTPGEEVPYYMGPLELRDVPADAGVGVFLTKDVTCGTLLLACYPLAMLRGRPVGHHSDPSFAGPAAAPPPSPLELAHALDGAVMSPLAAAWMLALYDGVDDGDDDDDGDGVPSGGGGSSRTRRRLGQLRQLFRVPFGATAAAAPDEGDEGEEEAAGGASSGRRQLGVRCPLPDEAVARVVTFNAYGESKPDPAVSAVRSLSAELLSGCVGLWPPFSLINHSCAPVASYGLVGDVMVVRAAADLPAGQQVTISYFGRRALGPLELRRAYLRQHYGFVCACERCVLEAAGLGEGEGEGEAGGGEQDVVAAAAAAAAKIPKELPGFIENLHTTCSRVAAPHLYDMLTGRRWATAAAAAQPPPPFGSGPAFAVPQDEPVSELVEELSELYGYLSESWQQLLRAAAATTAAAAAGSEGEEETAREEEDGADGSSSGGGGSGGVLSQQEVLWLEGSVFVLLDQLLVVVGALGLLQVVQERQQQQQQQQQSPRRSRRRQQDADAGASSGKGRKAKGRPLPLHKKATAGAQEVAAAVAPGSDLAVACAVRLLYGIQAVLGPESDEFQQAEISCYDALSARNPGEVTPPSQPPPPCPVKSLAQFGQLAKDVLYGNRVEGLYGTAGVSKFMISSTNGRGLSLTTTATTTSS
ncbi:hypothetical protein VOLCADRAFT_89375 [Volvox carteri f. nagariensis]|uniref:SET domain-containing protein n=1 Tax=Volvox carteri f. nagariensis TaxID=3068 RepID=D8TRJ3_VOLCA|nr:uncharacterized protein VOLCADRAFT_89375 [Volvox carteri f. nagariensis]EFJ49902.1 hypothetical protein VOLCADRAFT_89375 [Volvox carteri f. nagariensis]|eukprot:XP_002948967.1 hypothetical protein VOLCADRAFT_89375 [Volvox carteri f. nagariensis]